MVCRVPFSLTLVTPPASEPVTLTEVKSHLRVDSDGDDARINELITVGRQHLDGWDGVLGRAIQAQTWDLKLDWFPRRIWLPLPPLQSVSSITYVDADGASQTLDTSVYVVVSNGYDQSFVELADGKEWPSLDDAPQVVTVRFVAGYSTVPAPIKQAIKMGVQGLYDTCDDKVGGTLSASIAMLIAPYKVHTLYPA